MLKTEETLKRISSIEDFDDKSLDFVQNLLIRGYGNYGIPEIYPQKLVDTIRKEKNFESIKKEILNLDFFKDKDSALWNGRERYKRGMKKYTDIFQEIEEWLEGNIILDVGCGDGTLGKIITQKSNMKEYIGTDILPQPDSRDIRFRLINQPGPMIIPADSYSIDTALIIDTLHHVDESIKDEFLSNVKGKLANHGRLILYEYAYSEKESPKIEDHNEEFMKLSREQKQISMYIIDWLGNVLISHREDIYMPLFYRTKEELEVFLEKHGFEIIYSKYIGFPKNSFHRGPYSLTVCRKSPI